MGLAALGRVVPAPSGAGAPGESLAAGRSIWWGWEGAQTEQEQDLSWAADVEVNGFGLEGGKLQQEMGRAGGGASPALLHHAHGKTIPWLRVLTKLLNFLCPVHTHHSTLAVIKLGPVVCCQMTRPSQVLFCSVLLMVVSPFQYWISPSSLKHPLCSAPSRKQSWSCWLLPVIQDQGRNLSSPA